MKSISKEVGQQSLTNNISETIESLKKKESIYIGMIRRGQITKDKAVEIIVGNMNHHAKILANIRHDDTFRYQSILNHRYEVNRYVDEFKEVVDWAAETKINRS